MPQPILTSKLYCPPQHPDIVPRTRLLTILQNSLTCNLTLISAPAGFGKTTLVSQWLEALSQNSSIQPIWYALDEHDNDLPHFLNYLVAGLQQIEPTCGQATLTMIQTSPLPPVSALMSSLLNEVAQLTTSVVLVLDDYHRIEETTIHTALTFFLTHLPSSIHLVMTTRSDPPLPLSRLRARRQLVEVRAPNLRFTPLEITEFFKQQVGLQLTSTDITALGERTEGWIAGLQLAALSLQQQPNPTQFIHTFAGDDRYIMDYLVDEVLSQQPALIQSFLLQTAILERLNASLAEAICDLLPIGQSPFSSVADILAYLEQTNLFIVPLDNRREWYRYHHLFADLLRHRARLKIGLAGLQQQNQRASRWYAKHGFITEAIDHALSAEDFNFVGEVIVTHRLVLLSQLMWHGPLNNWLSALPEKLLQQNPYLLLTCGWNLLKQTRIDQLIVRLQQLSALPKTARPKSIMSEMLALQALVALIQHQPAETIRLSQQALTHLAEDNLFVRGQIALNMGYAGRSMGQVDTALQAFEQAAKIHQQADNHLESMIAWVNLGDLYERCGQLPQASEVYQQAIRLATDTNGVPLPSAGAGYLGYGRLLYQWNRLTEAEAMLKQALVLNKQLGLTKAVIVGTIFLAQTKQAQGDVKTAHQLLHPIPSQLTQEHPILVGWADAAQVPLWLKQNNLPLAQTWLETHPVDLSLPFDEFTEMSYLSLLRVQLAQTQAGSDDHIPAMLKLISRFIKEAEGLGWISRVIELYILQSLYLTAQRDYERALTILETALTLAQPGGHVRLFLDELPELQPLLHKSKHPYIKDLYPAPNTLAPMIDPLSKHEQRVLRLMAAGLSNQQIATELIVSINTVKWHARNIYGKLMVKRRTEAIAKARELGLFG